MSNQGNRMLAVGEALIPVLGCGTWELRGEQCAYIVAEALKIGYRHIDTAQGYDNEAAVGEGIRASAVRRDEIFVTTKVRPQLISQGALQRSVEESLMRLGLDQSTFCSSTGPIQILPSARAWPRSAMPGERD